MSLSDREWISGALINIESAREHLDDGYLARADEDLAVAQRLLLRGGARDVGPLEDGRDLPSAVYSRIHERNRKIERLEKKLEKKEEKIAELESRYGYEGEDDPDGPTAQYPPIIPEERDSKRFKKDDERGGLLGWFL